MVRLRCAARCKRARTQSGRPSLYSRCPCAGRAKKARALEADNAQLKTRLALVKRELQEANAEVLQLRDTCSK